MTDASVKGYPILLCADDYGLSPGVSCAILRLALDGRISALSCMTVGPSWRKDAAALEPAYGRVDVGLHLCLTALPPLGAMPVLAPGGRLPELGSLIRAALLRRLPLGEIAAELERQFDAFIAATGRLPDFLDGHQHVHQLPGIRWLVLDLFRRRLDPARHYVRNCYEPPGAILRRGVAPVRALVLSALAAGFPAEAARAGVPCNDGFRGVHAFDPADDPAVRFDRLLAGVRGRVLVNCHPGLVDETLRAVDPVHAPREAEYRFLSGDAFPGLLAARGLRLGRFTDLQRSSSLW
ncbi:ChbG/HpnK family deacetylase [Rhodocista pekingensis]|uniref:ChbG/HpnK family deacetylase n=1 Tax=Rhodocista pekingensis TaxID=201185 RepID=A0ABW2L1X6_9PROT